MVKFSRIIFGTREDGPKIIRTPREISARTTTRLSVTGPRAHCAKKVREITTVYVRTRTTEITMSYARTSSCYDLIVQDGFSSRANRVNDIMITIISRKACTWNFRLVSFSRFSVQTLPRAGYMYRCTQPSVPILHSFPYNYNNCTFMLSRLVSRKTV